MNFCSITIRYDQHQARRMEPKTVACRLPVACSQLPILARELRTWSAYLVSVKSQIFENAVEHQLKLRNVTISNVAVFAVSQNCISGVAPDGAEETANDARAKTSANQPKTNRQQDYYARWLETNAPKPFDASTRRKLFYI